MRDLNTCWHEAGHALVAHLCGRIVTGVSADAGDHFAGLTNITLGDRDGLPTRGVPLILQTPALRREVETDATIDLAGYAAEQVHLEHRTLTTLADLAAADRPAAAPARPVATRTPEQATSLRQQFEDADRPDLVEDGAAAWKGVARLTASKPLAHAVLDLCEQQALHLLRSRLPTLLRIATALHRHGDLDGADLLDLIEQGQNHASNQAS